jgi:hypothetical protein
MKDFSLPGGVASHATVSLMNEELTYEGFLAAGWRSIASHDGSLRHAGGEGRQGEVRPSRLDKALLPADTQRSD